MALVAGTLPGQHEPVSPRRYLAAIGDANDPVTWGGIPYHFLQAAKKQGVLDDGLALATGGAAWTLRRWSWNARQVLAGDRPGGYQYSVSFLESLWAPCRRSLPGSVVLNCFELFPPSLVADASIEKWFFIDQTLTQLLDYYELRGQVGRRIAQEAVAREREGYHRAAGIIAQSHWAARSVTEDYGVPAERVHVVVAGANLDPGTYAEWELEETKRREAAAHSTARRTLRLIFVGKDWRRKGLDRLLRALGLARRQGLQATLRVIGCQRESLPSDLQDTPGVEWLGFLDKRRDPVRFLRAVAECDVGCLLSRAEAGGIALREYVALGLMVLGPDSGGAPEYVLPQTSFLVSPQAPDEQIAAELLKLEADPARLETLRALAWQHRRSGLWDESVRQLQTVWLHSEMRSHTKR